MKRDGNYELVDEELLALEFNDEIVYLYHASINIIVC
jgi:hypothetical protein